MKLGYGYVLDKSRFFVYGGVGNPAGGENVKHITEYDFENDAWIQGVELHRTYRLGSAVVSNE